MNNRILLLCTILFGLLSFFSNAAPTDIYSSDDEKPYVVLMKKPKSVEKLLMQKDFLASNSQLRQKITSFYSFGDFEGFSGVFNRYTLRGFWRNSLVSFTFKFLLFKQSKITNIYINRLKILFQILLSGQLTQKGKQKPPAILSG